MRSRFPTDCALNDITELGREQVVWLMGAPAGLKLHAELAAALGGAALAALQRLMPLYAAAAPLLPMLLGQPQPLRHPLLPAVQPSSCPPPRQDAAPV